MIKKGKHFLFGCSLVFAVGAALVAPSVKADTVETKPESGSTTETTKPTTGEENVTYAAPAVEVAPAAVAKEKVEKAVETTQNSKEEPVVAAEKAKETDSIQAPEVTVVYNPSALTDEEKAKVVAAVKVANPTATDVQVQADGSVVVTFADGSSANLTAAQTIKDGSQVAKPRRARAAVVAPVITSNLDGKGSSATDVTVQAPAGSTVKLYNSDGVVIGEAVANAQGVATISPTNSLPVGEITATATPAGGSESPKSAPVTATRPTLTTVEGGVSGDAYTKLLISKSHITVCPGDEVSVDVIAASAISQFYAPKNATAVYGLFPQGNYFAKTGTETFEEVRNKFGGTVHEQQPAGDVVVTFLIRNKNGKVVTRDLKVTVIETAKKYEPVAGEKVEVADPNNVSEEEKKKIIASVKAVNTNLPANSTYSVDEKGNLVITYPDKSTDKISALYLVTPAAKDAENYSPVAKAQTVAPGSTPEAKNSIGNVADLPSGTTFAYKTPVDTTTPGEKDAIVVVTYPDGSKDEVPVKVTVAANAAPASDNTPAKKAGAKELPNTGTKQSSASLALALLAAATGGLLIAKKREEEE